MTVIDDDYAPVAAADTGTAKEWTDDEVRAILDEDEKQIKLLKRGKEILVLMNRALEQLERENAEERGELTSILREKVLRGVVLSNSELESVVFAETCRLLFARVTTKEFLRRMVIIGNLTDLDSE